MKSIRSILLWTAVALWMALIFMFSMENAAESGNTSGRVIRFLLEHFRPGFTDLSTEQQLLTIEAFSYFVRKTAHFCIFAGLGFLTCSALWSSHVAVRRAFFLAVCIGAIYAVSDEIHQAFVPGRACMIRDMLLDSCGVLSGTAFLTLIRLFYNKSRIIQIR